MKKKPEQSQAEKPHVMIRKASEMFRIPFTEDEMREKSKELAMKHQEANRIKDEKSSVMQQFSGRIKEVETRIQVLSDQVSTGSELRSVRCEWHMNVPRQGRKTLFRTDTLDKVREEEMLDNDCQMVLDDMKAQNGETERTLDEKDVTAVDGHPMEKSDEDDLRCVWECEKCGHQTKKQAAPPARCPDCDDLRFFEVKGDE